MSEWRRYGDGYHRWHLMRPTKWGDPPRAPRAYCGEPLYLDRPARVDVCQGYPEDGRPLCQRCLRLSQREEAAA